MNGEVLPFEPHVRQIFFPDERLGNVGINRPWLGPIKMMMTFIDGVYMAIDQTAGPSKKGPGGF